MAARKTKAAKAGAKAAPYIQRVVYDAELRDNVRVAVDSAREAFARLQKAKTPAKAVLDDKKFQRNLQAAAAALKDAGEALRESPKRSTPKRKRGGGLLGKLLLLIVAAGIALAVSEDLRNKALDLLFGKEEEFEYSAAPEPNPAPPTPAATA